MSPMMPPGMGGMPPMMPPGMGMGGMPPMPMPPGMGTPPSAGAFGPVSALGVPTGPIDPSALLQMLLPLLMGMGGGMPGMPPAGGMPTVPPQQPVPGLPPGGMMPPAGGPPLY